MKMKKLLTLVLALLLVFCSCLAEDPETEEIIEEDTDSFPAETYSGDEAVTEKDGWHFNSKGFLAGSYNPVEEYLKED